MTPKTKADLTIESIKNFDHEFELLDLVKLGRSRKDMNLVYILVATW